MADAMGLRRSFDEVADVYHAIRPAYPAALFAELFELLPQRPAILEVGPGTGQATRDLLCRGASVHAVEIGPNLARLLRDTLPHDDLTVTVAAFEDEPLDPGAYDCVFAATAYHWVDARARTDRPADVLRPGGVIAIVDLIQVDSDTDHGFFAAAQPIYDAHGEGHRGPPAPKRSEVDPPMRAVLARDPRFDGLAVGAYDWDQTYTAAEYRQLMCSYSGTQMMEPERRIRLLDDMEAFVREQFDGHVTRPLVVTLTTARRVASAGEARGVSRERLPS